MSDTDKWTVGRDEHGHAATILYLGRAVLHILPGLECNEENADRLVAVLNAGGICEVDYDAA